MIIKITSLIIFLYCANFAQETPVPIHDTITIDPHLIGVIDSITAQTEHIKASLGKNKSTNDSIFIVYYNNVAYRLLKKFRDTKGYMSIVYFNLIQDSGSLHPRYRELIKKMHSTGIIFDGDGICARGFYFYPHYLTNTYGKHLSPDLKTILDNKETDDSLNFDCGCMGDPTSVKAPRLAVWDKIIQKYPQSKHILTAKKWYSNYCFIKPHLAGVKFSFTETNEKDLKKVYQDYAKKYHHLPSGKITKLCLNQWEKDQTFPEFTDPNYLDSSTRDFDISHYSH